MSGALRMYTIYRNPSDYPGKWVLRGCSVAREIVHDAVPICVTDSLTEARAQVPLSADVNMGRQPGDDPVIYEVWV